MRDGPRAELEALLVGAQTVRDHLDDFAARAGGRLGPGTLCSISVRQAGHDRLAASSGPRATACDEAEFRAGAGPCVTAMDDLQVVLVPDVAREDRWPDWTSQTRAVGFRSSAAVPAHVADGAEVALNLYNEQVDAWDADALLQADGFAQEVARTVGLCLQVARLTERVDHLAMAVAARDVINQAIGVVMVTNACSADEAMAILRSASTNRAVDMVQVAAAVVEGITGHDAHPVADDDDEPAH